MSKEIERKFLVADLDAAIATVTASSHIRQGYLSPAKEATVRVRVLDNKGYLTVKSPNRGASRGEWEYEIPATDAEELLALSRTQLIEKTRYFVPFRGHTWEVDVVTAPRRLILAEVELNAENEEVALPPWLGKEVTGNPRYYNSTIAQ